MPGRRMEARPRQRRQYRKRASPSEPPHRHVLACAPTTSTTSVLRELPALAARRWESSLLATLPDELLSLVLCRLDSASSLGRLCSTCRRFNRAAPSCPLWASLLRAHLAVSPSPVSLPAHYFTSSPGAWLLGAADRPPGLRSGLSWRGVFREVLATEVAARTWKLRKTLVSLTDSERDAAREMSQVQNKAQSLSETLRRRGPAARELKTELAALSARMRTLQSRLRDLQAAAGKVLHDLQAEESAAAELKGARIHQRPAKPTSRRTAGEHSREPCRS